MHEHTDPTDDALNNHIADLMVQIAGAADKTDIAAIEKHLRKAQELKQVKEQKAALLERIASLTGESARLGICSTASTPNGTLRELPIEVTDGMIRQNLLTLTPHIKRGKIKIGEELIIDPLPVGDRFRTDVVEKGNKLRERGKIARFYRDANVKGGDYVLLAEIKPGHWTLRKAPPGMYGLSRNLNDYA